MPLLMVLTLRVLGHRVQHIYFSLPLASEMSYGKKVGKFKPKVPALQGRGLGREKKRKKKKKIISQSLRIKSFKKKTSMGKAFNA